MSQSFFGPELAAHADHPALTLLSALLDAPAVSGHEEGVAQIVRDRLTAWGYAPETDAAGNVLVRFAGDGPLVCLAAHTDEIGMVVAGVNDDGSLRVERSGGLYPWKLGEGPVEIRGDQAAITGVLSMGSTHRAGAEDEAVRWRDVRVLTGLTPGQLAAAGVRVGSPATPVRGMRGPVVFGDPADPLVAAWTFDDRMGVVALLRMLEQMAADGIEPRVPLIVAFTTGEEIGGLGAKSLAFREKPEIVIAVDGCPTPPEAPLALDGRPGIWTKDRLAAYDPALVRDLCAMAVDVGTELQPAVYTSTASDASLLHYAGLAPRIACFGHVRENSHGYEVARLAVFDRVVDVLVEFVRNYDSRIQD